ncbi:hypothetical protein [Thiocapsa bogorovii]|uniref:hypothetical protein n=1 Tax=Thiocapsa bogorovii TaxID=521689 RepID=UPI001E3F9B31|nr:hypothetical protein [Thiocapsa bogorovii]UHD17572.1 hypothetical protein LT988_05855 [Thiocapsa bogorovii]
MHNGDRLTDRVIRQDGNLLTLQTDYAGTLEIARAYDSKPSDQALTTNTTLLHKLGYQWQ